MNNNYVCLGPGNEQTSITDHKNRELSNKTIKNFEATMEKDSASMTKAHEQMSASGNRSKKGGKKKKENRCRKVQEDLCRKEEKKIKSVKTGS
jgi:hypothetical protein